MRASARNQVQRDRLSYFLSREGAEELWEYNKREFRTVQEVLSEFSSCQGNIPVGYFLDACPLLFPRPFSIASSPHCGSADVCAKMVNRITPYGRERLGLCTSRYLKGLGKGEGIAYWLQKGKIRYPQNLSSPLILIGPGTGFAPMRSIILERIHESRRRPEVDAGPICLFFGCRYKEKDHIYKEEMEAWDAEGVFRGPDSPKTAQKIGDVPDRAEDINGGLFRAFSRENPGCKRYVTNEIEENGEHVWRLIKNRAYIVVAGSANRMPDDVFRSIRNVVSKHGNMSVPAASKFLRGLERSQRYITETW